MFQPVFSVLIVSWNVRAYLRECLESLSRERNQGDFEVIVVDNASYDGSAAMVRTDFNWVKLMESPRNLGFAAANNLAARSARGEFFILLNPDASITPGFFNNIKEFYGSHKGMMVLGGKIINSNGSLQPSVRHWPTVYSQILVLLKIAHFFPKLIKKYLAADFDYTKAARVDQVMGACFIVPRTLWQNLNGFDEKFFVWFEEVDFCKRLVESGGEVWYSPKVLLSHQQKASFKQLSAFRRHKQFSQSAIYYFYKHYSWPVALIVALAAFPALVITYVVQIFSSPSRP